MTKSWKEHLLRSGVPLEYQVARILAHEGMSIDADFAFLRRDVAGDKEWSVDLSATKYGKSRTGALQFELSILVECKYRSKDKVVLLLPDPNTEFPNGTLGGTTRIIDAHCPYHLSTQPFVNMERTIPFTYKGIEIHEGGAVEQDLRHAIQQLRYAVPLNIRQRIDFSMTTNMNEVLPIFLANIIVTNAEIRILRDGLRIEHIEAADQISDISQPATHAVICSDYGPDYETHFRSVFSVDRSARVQFAQTISDSIFGEGKLTSSHESLVRLVEDLATAQKYVCSGFSTQFFITSPEGLPSLVKAISEACAKSFRSKTKTSATHRWIRGLGKSKATPKSSDVA